MGAIMKVTVKNIIDLWFSEDTPIRHYKIRVNPPLWAMCQQISQDFVAPSGRINSTQYRKSDKMAFARQVLAGLAKADALNEEELCEPAQ